MKIKALYKVAELSELSGIPVRTLRRWLIRDKVSIFRSGRSVRVPLPAFRDAFPQLWEAIRLEKSLKPGKCEACRSVIAP